MAVGVGQISVVIPAYNASAYLGETLRSVRNQSELPREVIVVDDGSTDDTIAIARSFGARVISLANGGPSAARNAGTQAASGRYIAFLDADDIWSNDKLAVQLKALQSCAGPAFSFTDFRVFDEGGIHEPASELLRHWAFRKVVGKRQRRADNILISANGERPVLFDSFILPSSIMVRRVDFLAIGGFDEMLRAAEDFEFYLRLFKLIPAVAVMRPLLLYRRHADQATANGASMKTAFFSAAARIVASPERYPDADVRYIQMTEFLRHYNLGIELARAARFDEAILSFRSSLAARFNAAAALALFVSSLCRSRPGRVSFTVVRAVWKKRPWHRQVGDGRKNRAGDRFGRLKAHKT